MEHGRRIQPKMGTVNPVYYQPLPDSDRYRMRITYWLKKQILKEAPTALRMSGQIQRKALYVLPASETVKASFGGVEFTGKVEEGKGENVWSVKRPLLIIKGKS